MTIPREDLLQGCIALGLIYTWLPVMMWLRSRRTYPDGRVPHLGVKALVYGLFLVVGIAGLGTAAYVWLHPAILSLTF